MARFLPNAYARMTEPDYSLNNRNQSETTGTPHENDETLTKGTGYKCPTQLKFFTIGLVIGATIMSVVLFVHVLLVRNPTTSVNTPTPDPICMTKSCIETAIDIRRSMNLSANPCDNFYEFTCGRYFPEGSGTADPFEELVKNYDKKIEARLNLTSRPDENTIIKYAREVFNNCLTSRTDIDSGTVGRFIQKSLRIPQWPIREMTKLNENHLSELIADLDIKFNLEPLFQINIFPPTAKQRFQFKIAEPTFLLPLELRTEQHTTNITSQAFKSYTHYVSVVMREFGMPRHIFTDSELQQISEDVVRFEQGLISFASLPQNLTDYEKITIKEMARLNGVNHSMISPRHTLEYILHKSGKSLLNDEDTVHIFNSINFTHILSLISNTNQDAVYNYLGYRLAMELILVSPKLTFFYSLNPYTIPMPMLPLVSRPMCLSFVKRVFQQALSRYPDQLHDKDNHGTSIFGNEVARSIQGIYLNIQNELIDNLPKNNKLTEYRRKTSMEEFQKIQFCQEDWVLNDTQLDKYYAGIYPFEKSYLEQLTSLRKWESIRWYGFYGKLLGNDCDTLSDLSAAFYPIQREINVPPRYWMEPSYSEKWPAYLKYSGLGNTIGHEMMHALFTIVPEWIDNPITDTPAPGNKLRNSITSKWMTEIQSQQEQQEEQDRLTRESQSALITERYQYLFPYRRNQQTFRDSSCIVQHYEKFHLNPTEFPYYGFLSGNNDSLPVINGVKTFGENFADIGGLQMAYSAYQQLKLEKNIVVEKGLPGLADYSNDQLFYINYARHWCERRAPIMRTEYLLLDEHTPPEFRVLGTLRNNQHFANTWNCPVGSFMNPTEKCYIF